MRSAAWGFGQEAAPSLTLHSIRTPLPSRRRFAIGRFDLRRHGTIRNLASSFSCTTMCGLQHRRARLCWISASPPMKLEQRSQNGIATRWKDQPKRHFTEQLDPCTQIWPALTRAWRTNGDCLLIDPEFPWPVSLALMFGSMRVAAVMTIHVRGAETSENDVFARKTSKTGSKRWRRGWIQRIEC